ncbi:MAG: RtcB family protein [Actinobacteria bacterium]|nr:RtcB family protein [Actinomycetota bacterium]
MELIDEHTWRIEPEGDMRVPGIVYASEEILESAHADKALEQVMNVATLPGIVEASIAMPDIHWGYGFPIGGVAAMSLDDGVVSPGGVGFDINCGVRLIATGLDDAEVRPRTEELLHELMRRIPQGTNDRGSLRLTPAELRRLIEEGVPWLLERGLATEDDVACTEEHGAVPDASADAVSQKAVQRGHTQVGSLGAGNHFIELQVVDEVFDDETAAAWDIRRGQVTVMIHSGSRGFGHQTCTDHLQRMAGAVRRYGFELPDRQLACAPVGSPEGRDYLAGMAAAANFAFANRQVMMHEVRLGFEQVFRRPWERLDTRLVYDVAHNIAKLERHEVAATGAAETPSQQTVLVHRKGATRAFGPGRPELPPMYRETGQPVIIPGSMGTESWLLAGTERAMTHSFGSACHGAGRRMSRGAAKKVMSGAEVRADLEARGVVVRSQSTGLLAEEAPYAYKDVAAVVDVVAAVGLARKVARLTPLGVLKG